MSRILRFCMVKYHKRTALTGAGYTALYPCFNNWLQSVPTGYTALYSCFNNCLQSVQTRYGLHNLGTAYPTPPNWLQSHLTQSIQLCVESGAGRQQVSTNMASTDWLQSLQIADQFTDYTALFSPKPVAE